MSRLGRSSIAFVQILQYVVVALAVGGIVFAIIDEADAIWIRIMVARSSLGRQFEGSSSIPELDVST